MPIEASHDTWVVIDGARKIMVGSNNYMGLTHDPRILEAARKALDTFGSGNTGSRFLNGNLDLHERLEAELADFTGMEAALVFSTGYQTNLGTLGALIGRADTVFIDKLDHASLQDGVRLGLGRTRRFNHNDFATLRRMIEAEKPTNGKLIAVDGVYSMEGDIADLPALVELRREYGTAILVDDAHAVGVLGETGAGTAEHWGLTHEVDLILGTFSKSFASIGGFCAGRRDVIDYLRHNARALIFSASMPPASAATVLKGLEIIRSEPERRARLWRNTYKMMEGFRVHRIRHRPDRDAHRPHPHRSNGEDLPLLAGAVRGGGVHEPGRSAGGTGGGVSPADELHGHAHRRRTRLRARAGGARREEARSRLIPPHPRRREP